MSVLADMMPVLIVSAGLVAFLVYRRRHADVREIICANPKCDFRGPAAADARGSLAVGMVLCCVFLLPGLIYFMLKGGYRYRCPKCGLQIAADN